MLKDYFVLLEIRALVQCAITAGRCKVSGFFILGKVAFLSSLFSSNSLCIQSDIYKGKRRIVELLKCCTFAGVHMRVEIIIKIIHREDKVLQMQFRLP